MSINNLSRRQFLKASAGVSVAALFAACAPAGTAPTTDTASSDEAIELEVWHQDWSGANQVMDLLGPRFEEANPNATVNFARIGYSDLQTKIFPAVAAGTEADVMMMYTNWVVATDISQVFLDITDLSGGLSVLEEKTWPVAFQAISVPEGKVFYLPWACGANGCAYTVQTEQYAEAGIDYTAFANYEEFVEAAVALTQIDDDGKITRAGFAPQIDSSFLFGQIWQLGGEFFDRETGQWSLSSEEGEAAAQLVHDLYHVHKVNDFELYTNVGDAMGAGLVSTLSNGAWAGSWMGESGVPADNIVAPLFADGVEEVMYPGHFAGWGLSKQLADSAKLAAAFEFAELMVSPDGFIAMMDGYSGISPSKEVYSDPSHAETKYGDMSKRVADIVWSIGRYTQDHIADFSPFNAEFDRAIREEITIPEALANMDEYLNEQEALARERIAA
ncbi:MAG: extracellular solute-binding protein [Chloroflexota bacterium]